MTTPPKEFSWKQKYSKIALALGLCLSLGIFPMLLGVSSHKSVLATKDSSSSVKSAKNGSWTFSHVRLETTAASLNIAGIMRYMSGIHTETPSFASPPPPTSTPPAPPTASVPLTSTSGICEPPYDPSDGTGVTCAEYLAWSRVSLCESGGWGTANYAQGPNYFGNLGISSAAWDEYGSGFDRSSSSPDIQIIVAERIEGDAVVPDQGDCVGW